MWVMSLVHFISTILTIQIVSNSIWNKRRECGEQKFQACVCKPVFTSLHVQPIHSDPNMYMQYILAYVCINTMIDY